MRQPPNQSAIVRPVFCRVIIYLLMSVALANAEILPVKTYTSADGLIYESVRCIYQDSRGLMWFCAPTGLSRFDGYEFVSYSIEDGLNTSIITGIVEGDNGVYWIGSVDSGVFRFDSRRKLPPEIPPGRFVNYKIAAEGLENEVNGFVKTRDGRIFVLTAAGLFELVDGGEGAPQFSRVELKIPSAPNNSINVVAVAEDADGTLWTGHERGLMRRLASGAIVNYKIQPGGATDWVRSLAVDRENRLWLVTDRRNLVVFNPESADSINVSEAGEKQIQFQTVENSPGELKAGAARQFKPEESLADGSFNTIHLASDGKIRLGTNGKGLIEFDGNKFRLYDRANDANESLKEIAGTSREMVDSMGDIVWAINPQRDHLSDLIQRMRNLAGEMTEMCDIGLRVSFARIENGDLHLGADIRREIYLIFKETVNNLVKHSGGERAEIVFRSEGSDFIIVVKDDGKGFQIEKPGDNGRTRGGNGLPNMKRRADALGGSYEIQSETGKGTTATLRVPLKINLGLRNFLTGKRNFR